MESEKQIPAILKSEKSGITGKREESGSIVFKKLPSQIAGMSWNKLRRDYNSRIFNHYLPFWLKGGFDNEKGGFMCELFDIGSVQGDEKYIWYQGRGLWVYSFLCNNFGNDEIFLEIAGKSRDFMVNYMYLGEGKWRNSVNRAGYEMETSVGQGSVKDIYGALFAAAGLIEFYKASKNEEDLKVALKSINWAVDSYEDTDYDGIILPQSDGAKKINRGLRTQGHSFVLIWILTNLLTFYKDQNLEKLQEEHINHIINHFWNQELGIVNEYLYHDYSRIPGYDAIMSTGHSIEALWMVFHEAIRKKDDKIFAISKNRIRRLIEMNWDYVFGGLATESYHVFGNKNIHPGPDYNLKAMWAHTEVLIATMSVFEHTHEVWAWEWYEKCRRYCLKTMVPRNHGVWRQAVDRFGEDKQRPGISIYRKDNFHQIRYMMMNLLSIDRIIPLTGK